MKGARYCGLDFGTTNSTVGVVYDGHCSLVDLSDVHAATFPSAIFFDFDRDAVSYGHEAIDSYLAGHRGRIMWAPKNILGSSLMDDSTDVGTIKLSFFSIISLLIANLKERAEERSNTELRQVVLGRPVHYNDSDAAFDTRSEHFMRNIAQSVGFEDIAFDLHPAAHFYLENVLDYPLFLLPGKRLVEMVPSKSDVGRNNADDAIRAAAEDDAVARAFQIIIRDFIRPGAIANGDSHGILKIAFKVRNIGIC